MNYKSIVEKICAERDMLHIRIMREFDHFQASSNNFLAMLDEFMQQHSSQEEEVKMNILYKDLITREEVKRELNEFNSKFSNIFDRLSYMENKVEKLVLAFNEIQMKLDLLIRSKDV